jgi:hypothetical protein
MCTAQQAAIILCEKLQNMGSDLLDARAHITELERNIGNNSQSITLATPDLQRTFKLDIVVLMNSDSHCLPAERVTDMAKYLELQKHKTVDTISKLAQAEDQLAHCQSW